MPVVTIRGQLGSGSRNIGMLVAERIDGDYVDEVITTHVAGHLGVDREDVVAKEEPTVSIWARIAHGLERSMAYGGSISGVYAPAWQVPVGDTHYLEALTSVITELGRSLAVVIRGRGSQFILKEHPNAFHVLVVAPLAIRVQRVMERLKLDWEGARKEVERFDSRRRVFIKRYFNTDREDPSHYHLVINTANLSYEAAADIVANALRSRL